MSRPQRDAVASVLGILTFLGGVGMVVATFLLARDLFNTPPFEALAGSSSDAPLKMEVLLSGALELLGRVALLLVMCLAGSVIAARGIRLYADAGVRATPEAPRSEKD